MQYEAITLLNGYIQYQKNGVRGILSIWNSTQFTLLKSRCNKGYIIVEGIWEHKKKKQVVTIVYVYFLYIYHYKKKTIKRPIFSYQMKWLLIVTKIVIKLYFGC